MRKTHPFRTMIVPLLSVAFLGACATPKTYRAPDGRAWVEERGLIIIETERVLPDTTNTDGWAFENEVPGYTGTGYLVWRGEVDQGKEYESDGESHPYEEMEDQQKLTYLIDIATPGTYFLKVRNVHQHRDGDNDVWTSVNESDFGKTYDFQENAFTWDERGEWAQYELEKGIYPVEIAGRSVGFGADRLALFLADKREEENFWGDPALPESPVREIYTYKAVDFPLEGTKYYIDQRNECVAIDAGKYKDQFASTSTVFGGPTGTYRIKLDTFGENDGNSTYRVYVNQHMVGEYQGPKTRKAIDTSARFWHTFPETRIKNGATVTVESNTHTNGDRGDEYSRGRWDAIHFVRVR